MPGGADRKPAGAKRAATRPARVDHVISVPLIRLFYPDPDPTETHPRESADIEGYVVAPDHTITIAATATTPGGVDMLDSVWAALCRKGLGRRHMLLLDERGRTVSVMTLRVGASDETLRFLRSLLVVPVHAGGGFAEVHFLATPGEAEALEEKIAKDEPALPIPAQLWMPPVRETGALQPEDWAFLGLLSSVGAFDGPTGPTPELVADLLGLDAESFAEQAREVERGLEEVVTGLFAPAGNGTSGEALPS
jgi:hypothetical protein